MPASPRPALGGFARFDDGEIDVGFRDDIEQVGKDVLGNDGDDLHDLAVAEAGVANRLDINVGDMTTLTNDLGREAHGGIGLRVAGLALAIERDFLRRDLRQIQAQIGVRREAVITAST